MKKFFTQGRLVTLVVAGVLIIDQLIKIAVKTNMYLHENIHVTDWFYIYFTENNGMAFGLEIFAKLFLTLFRIVAAILITVYLVKLVKRTDKVKNGYLVCLSLILAGAVGNIIDCVFYGDIQREYAFADCFVGSTGAGIFRLVAWQGGRYVLLPDYRYLLA